MKSSTRNNQMPLDFHRDGVEVHKAVLSSHTIDNVKADIGLDCSKLKRSGIRNLEKKFESIALLTSNEKLLSIAGNRLGATPRLVRALFFDKTPKRNWRVSWHQDKTVTLNRRVDLEGWGPWSRKDGVHHVQPPAPVLNSMLTFRLHIDAATQDNGCLKVIPGSHHGGVLKPIEIERMVAGRKIFPCVVEAGDAVIMRPHILHSSSKTRQADHRRIVHLEYSTYELPEGIHWA